MQIALSRKHFDEGEWVSRFAPHQALQLQSLLTGSVVVVGRVVVVVVGPAHVVVHTPVSIRASIAFGHAHFYAATPTIL